MQKLSLSNLVFFFLKLWQTINSIWSKLKTTVKNLYTSNTKHWGRILVMFLALAIFLYYPLGGFLIHDIDTSSSYKPNKGTKQLASIDVSAYLINREVYYKLWTPNLPIFFPSYFLDNTPNFQLGLMNTISTFISALNKVPLHITDNSAPTTLHQAADLLKYPGDIWLFAPQDKALIAPSSATQYKKGRKQLKIFNNELEEGKISIDRSDKNLLLILKPVLKDINKLISKNEMFVRETQSSYINFEADDTFYYALGKLYTYKQLLNALGNDFKDPIVSHNAYQLWTSALKSLEYAADLNPSIVRNGKLNSSLSPNHVIIINYFAAQTAAKLQEIILKLEKNHEN